ncbi:MAG: RidA family protein [Xanthobacteraceae bacterium]|nr:RidA family protein [Xanthobacteraceae bacterium]
MAGKTGKTGRPGKIEKRLAELGITLPSPPAPVANYVPAVRAGKLLFCSGQVSASPGGKAIKGKLGAVVSLELGQEAAKICAINLLAQAKAALGSLDKIKRCVRLGGFINALPSYGPLPQVMNGASDLMVAVLGDAGRHARTTLGVAQLPLDAAVEVEAVFEIR